MGNYLMEIIVAVAVVIVGFCGVFYCQFLDEKHKNEVLRRARKNLASRHIVVLERKLENMLPLEIRKLNRLSDADFRKEITLLVS